MNTNAGRRVGLVVAASAILTTLGGCAAKPLAINSALPWTSAKSYETPEKVIAIWTDAVYQLPGAPATRGFGGRLYFYNRAGEAIPVDGELVVYAFDDSAPSSAPDQPSRKYAFTPEQLTRYYSQSELGASYNIWIPWDPVGGDEKQIALFPVFVDSSGKMVRGLFANNRLPGRRELREEQRRGFYSSHTRQAGNESRLISETGVRPARFDAPLPDGAAGDEAGKSGLVSHTIRVPRSLAERMAARPAATAASPPMTPPSLPAALPSPNAAAPDPAAAQPASAPPPSAAFHTPWPTTPAPSGPSPLGRPCMADGTTTPAATPAPTPSPTPPALGQLGFMGVDPRNSVSARSHAWARQDARSARFEPPQFRVPTAPGARPRLARVSTPLSP